MRDGPHHRRAQAARRHRHGDRRGAGRGGQGPPPRASATTCGSSSVAFPRSGREGTFDTVVLSEIGYYFSSDDLDRVIDRIESCGAGCLVACHWRHPVAGLPADRRCRASGTAGHAGMGDHGAPRGARLRARGVRALSGAIGRAARGTRVSGTPRRGRHRRHPRPQRSRAARSLPHGAEGRRRSPRETRECAASCGSCSTRAPTSRRLIVDRHGLPVIAVDANLVGAARAAGVAAAWNEVDGTRAGSGLDREHRRRLGRAALVAHRAGRGGASEAPTSSSARPAGLRGPRPSASAPLARHPHAGRAQRPRARRESGRTRQRLLRGRRIRSGSRARGRVAGRSVPALGGEIVASDDAEVLTSGRTVGRTPGGVCRLPARAGSRDRRD